MIPNIQILKHMILHIYFPHVSAYTRPFIAGTISILSFPS